MERHGARCPSYHQQADAERVGRCGAGISPAPRRMLFGDRLGTRDIVVAARYGRGVDRGTPRHPHAAEDRVCHTADPRRGPYRRRCRCLEPPAGAQPAGGRHGHGSDLRCSNRRRRICRRQHRPRRRDASEGPAQFHSPPPGGQRLRRDPEVRLRHRDRHARRRRARRGCRDSLLPLAPQPRHRSGAHRRMVKTSERIS